MAHPVGSDAGLTLRGFYLFSIQVAVVVAWEEHRLAAIDLNDFVGDLPYESAVVGYEADGAAIVGEG